MSASCSAAATVCSALLELTTPAGRCDRKGLLIAAGLLLAAQVLQATALLLFPIAHDGPLALASTAILVWLSTTAVAKRLHDLSLSAWRIVWAALGVIAWSTAVAVCLMLAVGPSGLDAGQPGYWLAIGATMLPVLAMTLWLHFAKGGGGDNAYGPRPHGLGFSRWSAHAGDLAEAVAR